MYRSVPCQADHDGCWIGSDRMTGADGIDDPLGDDLLSVRIEGLAGDGDRRQDRNGHAELLVENATRASASPSGKSPIGAKNTLRVADSAGTGIGDLGRPSELARGTRGH